jgi:hypothetical protein
MKTFFGAIFLCATLGMLAAAEITVPRLEMASRGKVEDGEFTLASVVFADVALNGGYKYGIFLGFSFEADDLAKTLAYRNFKFDQTAASTPVTGAEYNALVDHANDRLNNQGTLSFRVAKATARDLFNLPLELSYFIGEADSFGNGDEFASRFGTTPIGTDFRGFFYFPDGIGGNIRRQYNGIYQVRGTGLSLALARWDSFVPMLYLYEDFSYMQPLNSGAGEIRHSGDMRFLINQEVVKLEIFGGASMNSGLDSNLRGGLLAHFSSAVGAQFLIQCGVPGWEKGEKFSIDNFYFLMEPRLFFDKFGVYVTFFYHPVEYIYELTRAEREKERGKADINIKLLSKSSQSGFSWGAETTMGLKIDGMEDFSLWVSPFAGFLTNGLMWDAKLRVNTLGVKTPSEMFEIFIGVRTAF